MDPNYRREVIDHLAGVGPAEDAFIQHSTPLVKGGCRNDDDQRAGLLGVEEGGRDG